MKRLGGMQPYFFPYIGYWQLIDAVDCFVLFDDAQYMKQGWVNRNRILTAGSDWNYITVPVAKHASRTLIKDVLLTREDRWRRKILNQVSWYRKTAPYYDEIHGFLETVLLDGSELTIGELNCSIVVKLAHLLSIKTDLFISSEHQFDYSEVRGAGDWALAHALHLGATEVVNPAGGFGLLDVEKFTANGIGLSMIQVPQVRYGQPVEMLQPSLSIIDVLMYNGVAGTRSLLQQRLIVGMSNPASGIIGC